MTHRRVPNNDGPRPDVEADRTIQAASDCPPTQTLNDLLNGTVPIPDTVVDHLESCQLCLERLDTLSDSKRLDEYRKVAQESHDPGRDLDPALEIGDLGSLAGMRVLDLIGRGGMGIVYRGLDSNLEREVAIKLLPRESSVNAISRFDREARAVAKLQHDYIVPVYQAGRTESGQAYLVMPLISGRSLKDELSRTEIPIERSAQVVEQIALGLQAAHDAGMIHRDVKPANILLDQEEGRAKLTDFGLVRSETDEKLTQMDVVCGTPAYMSPEQIENPDSQDARGDLYSLGVVMYECLTGSTPFRGRPMEIMDQHRTELPVLPRQLNSRIPQDLQNICLKALSKRPSDRYASARAFAEDLRRFQEGKPVLAREITSLRLLWSWCNRHRSLAASIAVSLGLLIVLAIGSSLAAWQLSRSNQSILNEKQRAEDAEKVAVQDRTAALETLESLVDSLYDELSRGPASIRARDKVVTAALEGLKAISEQPGDRRSESTRFRALLKMAELASLRKDHVTAEKYFSEAIALAQSRVDDTPDSGQDLQQLLRAQTSLAEHYFSRLDPKYKDCTSAAKQTLARLDAIQPNEPDAALQELSINSIELQATRMQFLGEPQRIVRGASEAMTDLKAIRENCADQVAVHWLAQNLEFMLGRAYLESHDAVQAENHFQRAENELAWLIEKSPEKPTYLAAQATLFRARGMAIGAMGRLSLATDFLEKSVECFDELAAAEPENRQIAFGAASSQLLLGTAYKYAGKIDAAANSIQKNIRSYSAFLKSTPDDSAAINQLCNSQFQLLDCFLQSGKIESIKTTLAEIRSSLNQFESQLTPPIRSASQTIIVVMGHVLGAIDGQPQQGEITPESTPPCGCCCGMRWKTTTPKSANQGKRGLRNFSQSLRPSPIQASSTN